MSDRAKVAALAGTAPALRANASLSERLAESPFQGYAYAYPHKSAYRPLAPATSWGDAWRDERRDRLFLYVHVPFCNVRCGFCNLFTSHGAQGASVVAYLDALERQIEVVVDALGTRASFSRLAIGGGTPTVLAAAQLDRLLSMLQRRFAVAPNAMPSSVETSPETADDERLRVLRSWGVSRISVGVQSFDARDCAALGRPQGPQLAHAALERIAAAGFATLNIDLIYGAEGQSVAGFAASIERALHYAPQELYLYPLYVRPLTGLGRRPASGADGRLELYRAGRALLLSRGYRQLSLRMFSRAPRGPDEGPSYCCQRDGMVGLGPGARSYTSRLHYCTPFAVAQSGVRAIIAEYCAQSREQHAAIGHGFALDGDERRRRFVIQGLLQCEGLALAAYRDEFGSDAWSDLRGLGELEALELASRRDGRLVLGERGIEFSDVIGPWLASASVQQRMEAHAWR